MTQEQAQAKADSNNSILQNANVLTQKFKILQSFSSVLEPNYILCVIPAKYENEYDGSDLEIKNAFARVYFKTVFESGTGAASNNYVENYDIKASEDNILSNYLEL